MSTRPAAVPPPAPADPTAEPAVDVVGWRERRLREAGFAEGLAAGLARGRVDLHALLQLVDRGCPPHLAARILAPDDGTVDRP